MTTQQRANQIKTQLEKSLKSFNESKKFNNHYCFNIKVIENLRRLNSQIENSFIHLREKI